MTDLLASAKSFYSQGEYCQAKRELDNIISDVSQSAMTKVMALSWRAAIFKALSQREKALEDLNDAIELTENPPFEVIINRGIIFSELGRVNESLFDMNRAIQMDAKGITGLINRSFVHFQHHDLDSSADDLLAALEKDPSQHSLRVKAAYILSSAGRFDEAVQILESAQTLKKPDAATFAAIAAVRRLQGRYEDAIKESSRAIDMNEDMTTAMLTRSIAYLRQGNFNGAIQDSQRVLELTARESPEAAIAFMIRAVTFCLCGDYDDAITICSLAIETWPDIAHLWFLRGLARSRLSTTATSASKDLRMAVKLDDKLESIVDQVWSSLNSKSQLVTSGSSLASTGQEILTEPKRITDGGQRQQPPTVSNTITLPTKEVTNRQDIVVAAPSQPTGMRRPSIGPSNKPVATWDVEDTCRWASRFYTTESAGSAFLANLRLNDVDGALLLALKEDDLEELGLTSSIQRRRCLLKIESLRGQTGKC